ncbi:MAG: hypothetical protein ACRDRO_29930 [Pseudonocardiaceae bacterium]
MGDNPHVPDAAVRHALHQRLATWTPRRNAQGSRRSAAHPAPGIRDALDVSEEDEVEFTITDTGEVLLRGMTSVPADQRWFWEPEWQAGEAVQ